MDPDLTALSWAAATTLVALMTTDSWEQVKAAFVGLWRCRYPQQAGVVDADLAAARHEMMAALRAGDEQAGVELAGEWQSRLRRLVAADEQLQDALGRLVEQFRPILPDSGQPGSVVMRARASGLGRVYQAGRDQTVIGG